MPTLGRVETRAGGEIALYGHLLRTPRGSGGTSQETRRTGQRGRVTSVNLSGWSRTTAIYAAVMAVALVGTWVVMFLTGGGPDMATEPVSTWSLLAAELATATLLLIGATGLMTKRRWGRGVALAALGMLLYTTINTIGVSAEAGIPAAAVFMALVAAGSAALIYWSLRTPA